VNVGRAPPWPSRRARPDKGESPNLGTFSPLISLAYAPHFLGVPTRSRPREHRRCAAARPAPSVASRHLTVVHRHPAKGRFFPCLDTFWSRSYRVKRQGGRRRETSSPARCGRAAFPLGQSVEHPWGAPNPVGVLGLHAGPHVVVAIEDLGGSCAAGHPGPSHTRACTALSCRRPHPDPVCRLRHRHARLPHGLQSSYSRLRGSHLSTKSQPAAI
jgi:hypothetical protein